MINQLQPIFDETGLHPSGHWFDPSSAHDINILPRLLAQEGLIWKREAGWNVFTLPPINPT
jgi:hypothetical protein